MCRTSRLIPAALALLATTAHASEGDDATTRCLVDKLRTASETTTVAELRAACADAVAPAPIAAAPAAANTDASVVKTTPLPQSAKATLNASGQWHLRRSWLEERKDLEQPSYNNPYSITAHRPNYFLLGAYNARRPESEQFGSTVDKGGRADKTEAEFQISLKFPIARNVLGSRYSWFGAYTERAFWQIYNGSWSRPFRETNHEPETWLQTSVSPDFFSLFGMKLGVVALGLNHQSNGQSGELSRSWNRVVSTFVFDRDNLAVALRPWIRIPEKGDDDDNPDIGRYMGNFELLTLYRLANRSQVYALMRNNLHPNDNKGALEIGYSFKLPYADSLRGYLQFFTGYGKSLLDYNHRQTSLGLGIELIDW